MPRPINYLTTTVQLPQGDTGIWSIILELDGNAGTLWSIGDVDARANMDSRTIRDFVRRLLLAQRIEAAGNRAPKPPSRQTVPLYRLIVRSLEAPSLRRDGTECPEPAIEKMWRVMKMLKAFTAVDIGETAQVEIATAERYLRQLADGDQAVLRVTPGKPLQRQYLLLRPLGAKAPKILRGHQVYDPNSKALIGVMRTQEVSP